MTTLYFDYVSNVLIILASRQLLYTATLFVLVLGVCALLKDRHPRLQMTLWLLVLVRALVPAGWSTSFSLRHLLEQGLPQIKYLDPWFHIQQLEYMTTLSSPVISQLPYITWSMVLLGTWLSTALYLLLRLYRQRRTFKRIIMQSTAPEETEHKSLFFHLQNQFKLRRQVRLVTGETNISPFTLGTLRPVIFLPRDMLNTLDQQALTAVLAHEIAHVKRYDDLWGLFRHILQSLLFFFPVVWFTNRQIDEQKEIACDRMAVTSSRLSVGDYANSLLTIVNHFRSHANFQTSLKVPSLSLRRKSYRARLLALKHHSIKGLNSSSLAIFTALLTLMFVMPMGSQEAISQTLRDHSQETLPKDLPHLAPPVKGGEVLAGFHEIDVRGPLGLGKIKVFHDGVDFKVPTGSPVFAMGDGVVTRVVSKPKDGIAMTSGGYVMIEHDNGIQASYHYVGNSSLGVNQRVKQGDHIGELLRVAFSPRDFPENSQQPRVPARVHISIRYQGVAINPAQIIDLSQYHR